MSAAAAATAAPAAADAPTAPPVLRNSYPTVTVVVEWENAKLSELGRARRMLAEFARQLGEVAPGMAEPPELTVLYDPAAIDPAVVRGCLDEAFAATAPGARPPVRLVPSEGCGYYRQKNAGAAASSREVVLFLDSDVVPEPGWLRALLGSFADPSVEVVCGNTYVEPEGLYAKAFAAFWFFPLRSGDDSVREAPYFFANNVAFRRDLFNAHGFPDLPLLRGQCVVLADALRRSGRRILVNGAARVSHPPPNGLAHFVKRAVVHGHDALTRERLGVRVDGPGTARRFVRASRRALRAIRDNRRAVGLGPVGAAAAGGIALAYYGLAALGEGLTRVSPEAVRARAAV